MSSSGSDSPSENPVPTPLTPPATSAEVSAQADVVAASPVICSSSDSSSLVSAGEVTVTTRSTSPPVESAPVTFGVGSPLFVTAVRVAPNDFYMIPPKDPFDGRPPMSVSFDDVVALSCRVKACEGRFSPMSASPHYWSLRCEHLQR
uniref:Ig-like domain-containing protein n=1 Tax=Peronospora matthiolae TaxID=2874970 RepID=A0AAV1TZW7_9STRA